jgi:hypothetical protein
MRPWIAVAYSAPVAAATAALTVTIRRFRSKREEDKPFGFNID